MQLLVNIQITTKITANLYRLHIHNLSLSRKSFLLDNINVTFSWNPYVLRSVTPPVI